MNNIKVVIFGSADSGKTTTIDYILKREKIAKIEYKSTTVALDYGNTIKNGKKIHIFATPGQERFKFMREILSNNLDGAILVIDNSKGITNTDIQIIENLNLSQIPYVIFLNKQDLNPGKIESNHFKINVPIILTTAKTGEGVHQGLETLLQLID